MCVLIAIGKEHGSHQNQNQTPTPTSNLTQHVSVAGICGLNFNGD